MLYIVLTIGNEFCSQEDDLRPAKVDIEHNHFGTTGTKSVRSLSGWRACTLSLQRLSRILIPS